MPPVRLDIQVTETGAPIIDQIAASLAKLAPAAQQASSGLQSTAPVIEQVAASVGKIAPAAQDAASGLTSVGTVSQATKDDFAKLGLTVDDLGRVFNKAGQHIQVLSGQVAQQGTQATQATAALAPLATATQQAGLSAQIGATRFTGLDQTIGQARASFQQLNPVLQGNSTSFDNLLSRFPKIDASAQSAGTALQQTGTQAGLAGTALTEAGQAGTGLASNFESLFKSGAQAALGFATITGGLLLLKRGVIDAVSSMASFETALNNAYTNGVRSIAVQEQLRAQILQLPPALGSATELAKGLYEVLSSGIEPAKSVVFLEQSARLAKAGLSDLDSSTLALTKTMAAYRIPTEQAAEVSEILFKTVVLGQGHLHAFAQAFPTVTQFSSELGISLKDTAATLATLSIVFKSPEQAATGFKTLLADITQNMGKFTAAGIDVRAVIAEGGITGLFRELQAVTHGNAEALHALIPDVRGAQAALALMGPEFQRLVDIQKKYQVDTNEVGTAISLQTRGLAESWTAYGNALDRVRQEQGRPLVGLLTTLGQTLTETVEHNKTAASSTVTWGDALRAFTGETFHAKEAQEQYNAAIAAAAPFRQAEIKDAYGYGTAIKQTSDDVKFLNLIKQTQHEFTQQEETDIAAVQTALKSFHEEAGKQGVHLIDAAQLEEDATEGAASLQRLAALGKVSFTKIAQDAHVLHDNIVKALGTIPEEAAPIFQQLFAREAQEFEAGTQRNITIVEQSIKTINEASKGLKIIDLDKLKEETEGAKTAFLSLADGGKVPIATILGNFTKMAAQLRALLGPDNPIVTDFQAGLDKMKAKASESSDAITLAFKAAGLQKRTVLQQNAVDALATFKTILDSGQATPQELVKEWQKDAKLITDAGFMTLPPGFEALWQQVQEIFRKAGVELPKPSRDAFNQIIADGKKIPEAVAPALALTGQAAEAMAANFRTATGATNGLENSLQGLSAAAIAAGHSLNAEGEEVNKYGNAIAETLSNSEKLSQLVVKTAFKTDKQGLLDQLATAQKELTYFQNRGEIEGTIGGRDFTIHALNEEITAITEKLKGLGVVVSDLTKNPVDLAKELNAKAAADEVAALGNALRTVDTQALQKQKATLQADSLKSDRSFNDQRKALQSTETNALKGFQDSLLTLQKSFETQKETLQAQSLTSARTFANQKHTLDEQSLLSVRDFADKAKNLTEDSTQSTRDFADKKKALESDSLQSAQDFTQQKQDLDADALQSARDFADKKSALDEDRVRSARDFADQLNALDRNAADYAQQKQKLEVDSLVSVRRFADQKRTLDEESTKAARDAVDKKKALDTESVKAAREFAQQLQAVDTESVKAARDFATQKQALDDASVKAARDFATQKQSLAEESVTSAQSFADQLRKLAEEQQTAVQKQAEDKLTVERKYASDLAAIDQSILDSKRKFQDDLNAIGTTGTSSGGSGGSAGTVGGSLVGASAGGATLRPGQLPGPVLSPGNAVITGPNGVTSPTLSRPSVNGGVDPTNGLTRGYGGFGDYTLGSADASPTQGAPAVAAVSSSALIARPGIASTGASSSGTQALGVRPSMSSTGGIVQQSTSGNNSLTIGGAGGSLVAPGATVIGTSLPPHVVNPGLGVTRQVQHFAQGGVVQGSGGVDSELAFVTPGERVQTPQQQAQGSDRAMTITFGPVTINVSGTPAGSNPLEMGRIAAQAFITAVAPALNESLRRGGGEKFA